MFCSFSRLPAEPLSVQLVSEVASVQPGTPFYVGLKLNHKEHYHTYWKFPGIVGVPTDMKWKLPRGWKAGPIEWPAPERVMMFTIKAQGYHGEVLLPMKLTPPKDLEAGTEITLKGKASWMCCGRDCNPGFADLSVTLPVDAQPPPRDMRWQRLFEKARADMPKSLDSFAVTAAATRKDGRVTLRVTPQGNDVAAEVPEPAPLLPIGSGKTSRRSSFFQRIFKSPSSKAQAPGDVPAQHQGPPAGIFFTEDGYINADKDQVFRRDGDSLVVELIVSSYYTDAPPEDLRGILWLRDGSLGKGAIICAKFAK